MNIDHNIINKVLFLPDGVKQIYGWKTLEKDALNYEEGDIGLIDLIGTVDDMSSNLEDSPYLARSIWESTLALHEAKFCPDLGKINLSYVGIMDFTENYIMTFNIWIKLNNSGTLVTTTPNTKKRKLDSFSIWDQASGPPLMTPGNLSNFSNPYNTRLQTAQRLPTKPPVEYNLLSSRNLKYYYNLWKENKDFNLGKVNVYPVDDNPIIQ